MSGREAAVAAVIREHVYTYPDSFCECGAYVGDPPWAAWPNHLAAIIAALDTPAAEPYPRVQGRCPCCGSTSLFLGAGGYVTCSRLECPAPDAATDMLDQKRVPAAEPFDVKAECIAIGRDAGEGL